MYRSGIHPPPSLALSPDRRPSLAGRPLAALVLVWLSASALASALAAPLTAQTPEQRYTGWAQPVFPAEEYRARRSALLEGLARTGGGIMLVPSSDGVTHGDTFRQLDDFWYLTGLEMPESMLALDADAGTVTLYLPGRDPRFQDRGRPNDFPGRPLGDDPAVAALAGIERTADVATLPADLEAWVAERRILRFNTGASGPVGLVEPPLVGTLDPVETLLLRLAWDHPSFNRGNAFEPMARLRMRKSPAEVAAMQRAADATMAAIRETAASVRPGVDEATLRGVFEATCRQEGAQHLPFTPIVKSGPNSLWPWRILAAHYDRRNRVLEAGDVVILDVGCEVDGYVSDVGRTFPVGAGSHRAGQPAAGGGAQPAAFSALQAEKLEMVTRVADAVIAAVRPGVTLADLTEVAYDAIPDAEERYMQTPSYFGHHIGLSAGDPALRREPLAPGMVFTVEPWYYNHDLGVSVFVEDVVVVTRTGARVLTEALPRWPEELQRMVP